ncbi:hypothetical protein C923_00118 [Plasmodium falciparum UGT5.1]|uniref:Uncharacterized protein n=1 Tax=Plasmodium falciparum UGT5.1 TaxID=1237627 RepID=W7JKE5_PLAFA|nr:hypothetical protein C923_00118 [Plasmodium falciparum UGT5.1]
MHFVVEFQDWIKEPKDETISSDVFKRNFESKVENDLEELKKLSEDDYEKNCRHLNYLIDNIRELFFSSKNIRIPDVARKYLWDNQIEGNLKKLISSETKYKCQRNRINNPQKDRDLRIKVHDYCDERDKRLKDLTGKGSSENSCYDFMVWVNQNKDSITRDYNNNMSGVRRRAGFFKISNACDLNKFESLFPQMDCSSKIYEKDEVLRGPKDVLEIHQGGDQNTVGQEDLLSGKRKEEKSRDKDKHKDKEKKPSDISEEIYGIGRDMSETFVSPKTPVVEEAVHEYATNDCVGGTCVVFDCTKGECNLIKGSSDDEEAEKERVSNSIASSSTNNGGSLQSEKRRKKEDPEEDSTQKECNSEECIEEKFKKGEPEQPSKTEKSSHDKSQDHSNGPGKGHPKFQIPHRKGRQRGINEGTPPFSLNKSSREGKGNQERPKKYNRRGDSHGTKKKNASKGRSEHTIPDEETGKKRIRKSPVLKSPSHSKGDGESTSEDKVQIQENDIKESDGSETNSDSYQEVEGTIEVRQGDDGISSIFGIPIPNFFDYTDFNLSDFSLSNIPYPTIHIPFFPRSPRIYKGLYGGISRVRPNPTHINIDTYKAVDSVSELVNRLRDKAGSDDNYSSKERNGRKGDAWGSDNRKKTNQDGVGDDKKNHGQHEPPRSKPIIGQNGFSDRDTFHRGVPGESEDGKSHLLKSVHTSPGNDGPNEENSHRRNKFSEPKIFTLGENAEQSEYNNLLENHEQAVVADVSDPSIISLPYTTKEEVAVTYGGITCDGVIYEKGNPPCINDIKSNDIMSYQDYVSPDVSILGNEIGPINKIDAKGQHQSLNSNPNSMISRVLSLYSTDDLKPFIQGRQVATTFQTSQAQMMSESGGSEQADSESLKAAAKGPTNEVGTSTGRTRRSIQDPYLKEFSAATTEGKNGSTYIINKTNQSSSSFFDFSSLTKNILISLAIFGVIFLFIFSNKHRSLGMFNKKKKKRSRKSILIKEDNMNSMMLERYEDIDEEQNEKKNIYEEEHEDDENDDKLDDDDCDDIEFNKSGMI